MTQQQWEACEALGESIIEEYLSLKTEIKSLAQKRSDYITLYKNICIGNRYLHDKKIISEL
ncbi:MAG: hypothetical protein LE169_04340 [Endomicrobium sp.]|nr:hypothetical protein [Endomicrobium sp.]